MTDREHDQADDFHEPVAPARSSKAWSSTDPTLTFDRAPWQQQAACRDSHVSTFYPLGWTQVADARRICAQCPVKTECLDYGNTVSPDHGMWGGQTASERKANRGCRVISSASSPMLDRTTRQRWANRTTTTIGMN